MRSAESTRVSSCPFADRVASLSIQAYEAECAIRIAYKQTVLATIVLFDRETNNASVVALGSLITYYSLTHSLTHSQELEQRYCRVKLLMRSECMWSEICMQRSCVEGRFSNIVIYK